MSLCPVVCVQPTRFISGIGTLCLCLSLCLCVLNLCASPSPHSRRWSRLAWRVGCYWARRAQQRRWRPRRRCCGGGGRRQRATPARTTALGKRTRPATVGAHPQGLCKGRTRPLRWHISGRPRTSVRSRRQRLSSCCRRLWTLACPLRCPGMCVRSASVSAAPLHLPIVPAPASRLPVTLRGRMQKCSHLRTSEDVRTSESEG